MTADGPRLTFVDSHVTAEEAEDVGLRDYPVSGTLDAERWLTHGRSSAPMDRVDFLSELCALRGLCGAK